MKIAHLANMYGPSSGGLRTTVDNLVDQYLVRGHQVLVIVPDHSSSVEEGNGKWVRIASPRLPLSGGYRVITNLLRVRRHLMEFRPDLIEISDRTSLLLLAPWARKQGIKVVLFAHERLSDVLDSFLSWFPWRASLIRRWNGWSADQVDHVIATTRFAALEFSDFCSVEIVPLGVDHRIFNLGCSGEAPSSRGPFKSKPSTEYLFACTRLSPEKDPSLLLEVARELSARGVMLPLLIAGDGPLRSTLQERAMSERLNVSFLGFVHNKSEVARYMAEAAIFLAPGPIETFGLAALESLACGTPVICRSSGAISEVIDEYSGVALDGSASLWADAVASMLSVDRSEIAQRCKSRATRFRWDTTADQLLELYLPNARITSEVREISRT